MALFVETMTWHHKGAVKMADQMWHMAIRACASWLMPSAMSQQGEIALMQRVSGVAAVTTAFSNMFGDNVN